MHQDNRSSNVLIAVCLSFCFVWAAIGFSGGTPVSKRAWLRFKHEGGATYYVPTGSITSMIEYDAPAAKKLGYRTEIRSSTATMFSNRTVEELMSRTNQILLPQE